MQYVLGNMLNGGGGLNPDGLSLDLQFAADKTLTARKGPRPDFTRASTNGTFMGSNGLIQTAAINTPRFDHTSAGVCRGLLIEESRTNICRQSENFGSFWATGGCAVSIDTDVAPDGNTTADIVNITNGGGHSISQNISVLASTVYTFSFWVKRGTATALSYSIVNTNTASNIVAPTSYYNQTSSAWARVSVTFTTPVGCTGIAVYVLRDGGSTGTVLLWGAQVEAGSFVTSYIPTGAGSVARSADVCSITGANFNSIWNAAEGTMLSIGDSFGSAFAFYTYLTAQGSPSTSNVFMANFGATAVVIQKDTPQAFKSEATIPDATLKKLAYSYTSGSTSSSAINGAIPTPSTNNSTASVASASSFDIGFVSTSRLNGHIAAIRYYRKRLSNAKLAQLTV